MESATAVATPILAPAPIVAHMVTTTPRAPIMIAISPMVVITLLLMLFLGIKDNISIADARALIIAHMESAIVTALGISPGILLIAITSAPSTVIIMPILTTFSNMESLIRPFPTLVNIATAPANATIKTDMLRAIGRTASTFVMLDNAATIAPNAETTATIKITCPAALALKPCA